MSATGTDPGPSQSRLRAGRGAVLMVLAALCFSLMVACVKVARAELGAVEIVFWRSLVGLPLAALVMGRSPWRIVNKPVFAARAAFGMGAMVCYFTAAKGLDLADLSLLGRLQPVGIALLAPLALGRGERATRRTWILGLAGLSGCAILLGPDLAVGSSYGLVALVGVGCGAAAHTCLRALAPTDHPRAVVLGFQAASLAGSGAWLLVAGGGVQPPTLALAPWLLGVGVLAFAGQLLLTRAYQEDRAARVSAASHVAPVWAVLLDLALFRVVPGWNVLLGGAVVMAAALMLVIERPGGRAAAGAAVGEATPPPTDGLAPSKPPRSGGTR